MGIEIKKIFCFDDLLRDDWWLAKSFFYDIVREPIKQAFGINIGESPRNGGVHNLKRGFSPEKFKELCFFNNEKYWFNLHYMIPQVAADYLLEHISENSICMSYEMPPYLYNIFQANQISYIDIRISPIRFGADLYVALNTNIADVDQKIEKYHISSEELLIEANLLKASFNHLERYAGYKYDLNNCVIFVNQTSDDASLVAEDGKFHRVDDFILDIKQHCATSDVYYKAHPNAPQDHIKQEIEILNKILPGKIRIISENSYKMLSYPHKFKVIGISSGLLQEAKYFDKDAVILYRPVCPLSDESPSLYKRTYNHVHFNKIVSPAFWFDILKKHEETFWKNANQFGFYPSYPNRLRELHNVWWGYSESTIAGKHFYHEIIKHTGLEDRMRRLEDMQNTYSWKITKPLRWFRKLIGYK